MKSLVSVVIPAYNEEKTIKKVVSTALESGIFKEVICVNDGSTDDTLKILESFGKKIILIDFKKNKGKGAALAAGVKKSKSELVMFIDSDLVGLKTYHLKKLYNTMVGKRLEAVLGSIDVPKAMLEFFSRISFSPYDKHHDAITGERVYRRKDLLPLLGRISKLGYGTEIYLNDVYKNKKVGFVKLKGLTQLFKYDKRGWSYDMVTEFLKEGKEMAKELADQRVVTKINGYKKRIRL